MKTYSFKKSGCSSSLPTHEGLFCFFFFKKANKHIYIKMIIKTANIYVHIAYFVPGTVLHYLI